MASSFLSTALTFRLDEICLSGLAFGALIIGRREILQRAASARLPAKTAIAVMLLAILGIGLAELVRLAVGPLTLANSPAVPALASAGIVALTSVGIALLVMNAVGVALLLEH